MCGIFGFIQDKNNEKYSKEQLNSAFMKGQFRGPEYSVLKTVLTSSNSIDLGFHRLAINGLDSISHQPIVHDGISVLCNGEIYNYKKLYAELGVSPTTNSDCEVIIHLYKKYGFETMLHMIDGVYSIILLDENTNSMYVARDVYGVRPLFTLKTGSNTNMGFASEMKQLIDFYDETKGDSIEQFVPGTYIEYHLDHPEMNKENVIYSHFPFMENVEFELQDKGQLDYHLDVINMRLRMAVKKRVTTTDRPIACLLSGGLDSSLITALVAECFDDPSKLETYSIGLPGSVDIEYAEKVAAYLGTNHTSIIASESKFLESIPEVIEAIESYDTTTVRASVGNYLVAKYIKENSEAKVIFNGDGSDELSGGYLYFHEAPDDISFDQECKRLLKNIHYFDVLRSDRCISHQGLEARTPFLDRAFVEYYMTIPKELRNHNSIKQNEKFLIRKAFDRDNILPKEVLWRTKEAFSDGVSSQKKSWYEMIQDSVENGTISLDDLNMDYDFSEMKNPPRTPEQIYYRSLFEKYYSGMGDIIPYFWMPRFVETNDASARSLSIYSKHMK
jgi:asparagine synthase (glutamine-hydrolysing)